MGGGGGSCVQGFEMRSHGVTRLEGWSDEWMHDTRQAHDGCMNESVYDGWVPIG